MRPAKFAAALAAAALLTSGLAASARANQVFNDQTLFLATLEAGSYTETFNNGLPLGYMSSPHPFSGGGFSYSASTPNGFYNLLDPGDSTNTDVWLSTNQLVDPIVFTITSGNVTAIGGFFFLTNGQPAVTSGTVTATLGDGTTELISSPGPSNFVGFTTSSGIASLTITPSSGTYATVNDLTVGQAQVAAVPEPGTLALGLTALGLGGLASLRRRRSA